MAGVPDRDRIADAERDIAVLERAQEGNDRRLQLHDETIGELHRSFADLRVELAGVSTRVALITGGTMGGVMSAVIWAIKFFGG